MFKAAVSIVKQNWRKHICPSTGERIKNNLWYSHIMKYYAAIKMNMQNMQKHE